MAQYGKNELIRRLSDYIRKGWTNQQVKDLIDSLWRDPWSPRTSGFEIEGGTDCGIAAEATMTEINGQSFYGIGFQITPIGKKFAFYQYKQKLSYHKKYHAESMSFSAEEGLHFFYYDRDEETKDQVLKVFIKPTRADLAELFQWGVPICAIYYDAENNEIIYTGNNKHGSLWNPWIHWPWHQTFNSMRETGLEFTDLLPDEDGSEDAHAQFGVSKGSCFHEDIYASSNAQTAPADFPVWYFNAAQQPRIHSGSVNSLVVDGLLCYNSGGAAVPADEGYFVMYHIFYTNDIHEPFISVMGQDQYEKVSQASLMVPTEIQQVRDLLPHQNMLHIGTLLFETSELFENTYHSRLVKQASGVITRWSVVGDGSAATPVQLKNDEETPDPGKIYGTDPATGEKGWVFPDARLFGWGQAIYLHTEASGISTYQQALPLEPDDAQATYQRTGTSANGEMLLKAFATEAGYPGANQIKAGAWMFDIWAAVDVNHACSMKVYVYKRTTGNSETELFNFTIPVTAVGIIQHFYSVVQNAVPLDITDRLVFKYYFINPTLLSTTMYFSVEGATWKSNVRIPLPDVQTEPEIPIEVQEFDYADIESGTEQIYPLFTKAKFGFTILGVVLKGDATMDDLTIEINGEPVEFGTGVYSVDVTTSVGDTEATDDNVVVVGDAVDLHTSGIDDGASRLHGSIYYQRT